MTVIMVTSISVIVLIITRDLGNHVLYYFTCNTFQFCFFAALICLFGLLTITPVFTNISSDFQKFGYPSTINNLWPCIFQIDCIISAL